MRLFHFLTAQYGLEDIQKRRLKIATLLDLNDPFEMLAFSTDDTRVSDALFGMKQKLSPKRGLLCFSQNYTNPVQWSHYAEKHRGLCLGFDVDDGALMQVDYVNERLDANCLLSGIAEADLAIVKKTISTKFKNWSYEQEWRIWVTLEETDEETRLYFKHFDDDLALKEVIIGAFCRKTYDEVSSALGDEMRDVKIYKANLASDTFMVHRTLLRPQMG